MGLGDNTMRHRVVAGATMIVAAGLIGFTHARLPRPIRDYRDRVSVEMTEIAAIDVMLDWHRLAETEAEQIPSVKVWNSAFARPEAICAAAPHGRLAAELQ